MFTDCYTTNINIIQTQRLPLSGLASVTVYDGHTHKSEMISVRQLANRAPMLEIVMMYAAIMSVHLCFVHFMSVVFEYADARLMTLTAQFHE